MPRLKPPPGRAAAARVLEEPDDKTTDVLANGQVEDQVIEDDLPGEEDASVAFQKQIEALKRSEQTARERAEQANREREEAIRRARERDAEIVKLRKETVESQVNELSSALAAAQADAEAAQRDLAAASDASDSQAMAIAYRRLAKAETAIARLEDGKAELEERAKAAPAIEPVQEVRDPIESLQISPKAKEFLRENPHYMTNSRLNAKLNAIHYDLLDEGYEPYSDDYIEVIRERMQPVRRVPEAEEDDVQPQRRAASVVSAPVSREAPSSSGNGDRPGRITLSVAQKEAAKIAGVTEAEYAKNLLRLRAEKANGNYTGGQ